MDINRNAGYFGLDGAHDGKDVVLRDRSSEQSRKSIDRSLSAYPEAVEAVRMAVKKGLIRSETGFVNEVWLRVDDGFAERLGADVVEVAYRRTTP